MTENLKQKSYNLKQCKEITVGAKSVRNTTWGIPNFARKIIVKSEE